MTIYRSPTIRLCFNAVAGLLADSTDTGAIRAGFAELAPEDTVKDLIARADTSCSTSATQPNAGNPGPPAAQRGPRA